MKRHVLLGACSAVLLGTPVHAQVAADSVVRLEVSAALFAPERLATSWHEFSPALAPDGHRFYFTVTDAGFTRMAIMQSERRGETWSVPRVASFSGVWNDGDFALAPDGRRAFFISNRPVSGSEPRRDLDIWMVEAQGGGWGDPRRLPEGVNTDTTEVYPSVAADGTLYFGRGGRFLRSRLVDGAYAAPEVLPFTGFSLAVDPAQRFVIYGATTPPSQDLELWIRYREGDGWSAPQRLAEPFSVAGAADFAGSISPDGRTFFLVSTRRSGPLSWPRARPVLTWEDVIGEFTGTAFNGLRNIYSIDLGALPMP